MDGMKILASGFKMKEEDEIRKLVTAMGGVLQTEASSDVSFVIVKNVLAAKYKWALNNLKKPIVSKTWLHQCWKEHRVVSHESYRTLPFSGLTICVTQVSLDERKKIEMLVQQNGGKYSADLTKKCTHLVCDAPEGEKYKVAKTRGHVHIVNRAWFNQSVARRACLNEESYPVSNKSQDKKSSVFVDRLFRFSSTFPDIQRDEIVYWIHEGGGEVADSWNERYANYTVEAHGVLCRPTQFTSVTNVSSHWIRSCLLGGRLLDVNSHILFSPLQCKIPLPGFTGIRLCVSQYEEKDRKLLKNLCYFIGGKLLENLTSKVKYLVCKFAEGPKYEAACQCGMQTVTIEWIWECVKQITIPSNSKSTHRQRKISKKQPTRKWLDLPSDLTLNILQRVGLVDILENAQKVCTAWYRICMDPAMWRVIYVDRFSYPGKRDVYRKMCKHAVDRSQGQLLDLNTYGYPCAEFLEYVAQRSSQLRRLEVKVCYGDMCGVWSEAFKNLPLLEELSLAESYLLPKDIEVAGRYCPLLKTLKVNSKQYGVVCKNDDNEAALAIGKNLHQLTHLQLIRNSIENIGLEAILDGCCHLESLDLRGCVKLDLRGDLGKRCSQQLKHLKLPHHSFEGHSYAYVDIFDEFEYWIMGVVDTLT